MFSIRGLALASIAIGSAASAVAQSEKPHQGTPRAELAIDYSYMRANASPGHCGCFSLNGGSAEAAVRAYRGLSVVVDITGESAGTTSIPGQSLSLVSFAGGPRFSYPIYRLQHTTVRPFVQGLVGAVHGFDAPFPNGSGAFSQSANALAVLVGGGVDLAIIHGFSIRAVQVDYGLTQLPNNANNSQNLLRVSAGVVFRIR